MPQKKHVKKVRIAPRTDANQNIREHIERVRKQNEYIIKKIAEYKAKQEADARRHQMVPQTVDGLEKGDE